MASYPSYTSFEYIGDLDDDDWDDDKWDADIERAMSRLVNGDPYLKSISLSGSITSIGGHSEWYRLLDSISCHSALQEIYLEWYDDDSWLWTGGDGKNNTPALNSVLMENKSIVSIHVDTKHFDLSHIVDVVHNCRQLEILSIKFNEESENANDNAVLAFAHSVHKLTLLKELTLFGANIDKEDAMALTKTLFKKRTMKEIRLYDSFISEDAAHIFVNALRNDGEHTFTEVRLFVSLTRMPYTLESWKFDIELELDKTLKTNRHIACIDKFVYETVQFLTKVSFHTISGQEDVLYDDEVIRAMERASEYDGTDKAPTKPPDYLYSLVRDEPELIERAIVHASHWESVRMANIQRRKRERYF